MEPDEGPMSDVVAPVGNPCVFCEQNPGRTKEHVLPQHWEGLFPDVGSMTFRRISALGLEQKHIPGSRFRSNVKGVCDECNHGWMERLDRRVKPFLLELAWGRSQTLSEADASVFVSWATKVSLMRALQDQGVGQDPAPDQFHRFYKRRMPSDARSVQIAQASGMLGSSSNTPRAFAARDRSSGITTMLGSIVNVVTFAIGRLWFQVALFDAGHAQSRTDAMRSLAAVRSAFPARVVVVRAEHAVSLRDPLTIDEERLAREPLYLRGEAGLLG